MWRSIERNYASNLHGKVVFRSLWLDVEAQKVHFEGKPNEVDQSSSVETSGGIYKMRL
jgi:hypothetical protein